MANGNRTQSGIEASAFEAAGTNWATLSSSKIVSSDGFASSITVRAAWALVLS
jgi:hypothetical protein